MSPEIVKALADRQSKHNTDARKFYQGQRARILNSRHDEDIKHRIDEQHQNAELRELLRPHVTTTVNPADDVVSGVVQIYRGGGVRRIEGVTDEQQEAFQRLVAEVGITAWAADFARSAYLVGPKFAIPVVNRGRLRVISPNPHEVDYVLDVEDPNGDPVAIAFGCSENVFAVLDGEALRYFRTDRGHPVEDTARRVDHGAKDMPAAVLRFGIVSDPSDWMDHRMRERLRQGAIEVGVLMARLGLVRKIQGGKQVTVTGELEDVARGQPIGHPGQALAANISQDSKGVTFGVLDLDTDPAKYISQIRFLLEQMAESTGVPAVVESGTDKFDLQWDHDALAELRQAMLWWVIQFERQFWLSAVQVARKQRHPLAASLPTDEQIISGFVFELPPLHRRFADPVAELEWWKEMRGAGQADYLDMSRRYHPGLSDELLRDQLFNRIEFNAEVWKLLGRHNTPAEPDADDTTAAPMRSLSEEQGATGGRPPNESPDDDSE